MRLRYYKGMLDIRFIRDNKELVAEAATKKHIEFDVEKLIALDDERIKLLAEVESARATQNAANDAISKAGEGEREKLLTEMRAVKETLAGSEEKLKSVMDEWRIAMLQVPNIPDMSVPEGDNDASNLEYSQWGKIPQFSFALKNHIELMEGLGMLDLERGAKVSGFRGYFLKGDATLLSFALWRFAIDTLVQKGFEPLLTPAIVRKEPLLGTGYLPQGEEDLYRTQDGEYFSGTAEAPTMGYSMDETLELTEFPKKSISFSPCYRREAGSHGKDTRGIQRVHEFYKVEMVVLCEGSHEVSVQWHEELRENAEELMQALHIPYRVVINCGGDLGLGQVKKYDIEAWVPSEGRYRETHSISYFHDFQTRRFNIKYKDAEGKKRFAHSLNGTALATPRLLISLLENHQRADGSVGVPPALIPYVKKNVLSP